MVYEKMYESNDEVEKQPSNLRPISQVIRNRLEQAHTRYWAGDNIADYINPGEHEQLVDELEDKFEQVLQSLVIDTATDPNSQGTARRLAKMYVYE